MSDNELKKYIANMYYAMSRSCNKQFESINEDLDGFVIEDREMSYGLRTDDGDTYQLVLEFKKVSNIAYTLEDLDEEVG